MNTHKDLEVWKKAINLAKDVYSTTNHYPKYEIYRITSQMRRAAVSIGANIAEGAARQSAKEFLRFLYIALGSASELDTLIEISNAADLHDETNLKNLQNDTARISRMLQGLIQALKK